MIVQYKQYESISVITLKNCSKRLPNGQKMSDFSLKSL